jgi:CelD/BcsL family acetyltransferase involved in cellulose biosynthesis
MSGPLPYSVRLTGDIASVAPLWRALSERGAAANFAFQDVRWLTLWYRHLAAEGRAQPLIAILLQGRDDGGEVDPARVAMMLPLVRRTKFLLPIVEFSDRGVTDYNIALPGPTAPRTRAAAELAFDALAKAVRPYVSLRLRKMPASLGDMPHPFALLHDAQPSALGAHNIALPTTSVGYIESFGKKKRTEIQRVRRSFEALGKVRVGLAETLAERQQVFGLILAAQRRRVPEKGDRYFLEDDGYRQFYQSLVDDPTFAEFATITGVWLDGCPIAGLLGLRRGNRYIALRIGQSDDAEVTRLGAGKLLIVETARWAIDAGLRIFDFSLGGNALKAWFHPEPFPLIEVERMFNGLVRKRRPLATASPAVAVADSTSEDTDHPAVGAAG